jgi:hypothetical protein
MIGWPTPMLLGNQRFRHRVNVLDTDNFRQNLFGRDTDDLLDFVGGGARERDKHVGKSHVDLRLFLARGHQYRENTEQQTNQRQQGRYLGLQKGFGHPSGGTKRITHLTASS